jgi:hypothetical protein
MSTDTPSWTPPAKPSFNSPAADLNQLRNEAKRIAESAPGQRPLAVRARAWRRDRAHTPTPEGLSYADLAVLLSQSK